MNRFNAKIGIYTRRTLLSRALVSLAIILAGSAGAQNYVELILDASGSMFNRLSDGRFRIVAAKEVLTDFISRLPADPSLNVGLRIYGSQLPPKSEGACQDSRLFVPLKGLDRARLLSTVRNTQARGATPIAYSLQLAAKDFPAVGEKRIVLVTDGIESCDGDIQAVLAEIKAQGLDIALHIIGIDLDDEAVASFQGLGSFENTLSTLELAEALGGAVLTEAPKKLPVTVHVTRDGKPAEDGLRVVFVDAVKQEEHPLKATEEPGTLQADLEPGAYLARLQDAFAEAPQEFAGIDVSVAGENVFRFELKPELAVILEVAPPAPVAGSAVTVNFSGAPAGDGNLLTVTPAGAPDSVMLDLADARGTQGAVEVTLPDEPQILQARYLLQLPEGGTRVIGRSEAFESVLPEVSLQAPAQVKGGAKFEVSWTGPGNESDYLTVVRPDAEAGARGRQIVYIAEGPRELSAPESAGPHEVRYIAGQSRAVLGKTIVEVLAAGASIIAPAEVPAGAAVEVIWTGPGNADDFLTIAEPGAPENARTTITPTSKGSSLEMLAPETPGDYEIRYISGAERNVLARASFRVLPVTGSISAPDSVAAGASFELKWEGPNNPNDFLVIVPPASSNRTYQNVVDIKKKSPAQVKAPAKPGTYEIRYLLGQTREILAKKPLVVTE